MPDYPGSYTIECPKCNLGLIADTKELAVAAWNSRVISPELAAAKTELATVRNETIEECRRIADNADHAYRVSDAIRALKDKP